MGSGYGRNNVCDKGVEVGCQQRLRCVSQAVPLLTLRLNISHCILVHLLSGHIRILCFPEEAAGTARRRLHSNRFTRLAKYGHMVVGCPPQAWYRVNSDGLGVDTACMHAFLANTVIWPLPPPCDALHGCEGVHRRCFPGRS